MRQLSFLDKFPKRKPPLPYNIRKIFNQHYLENRKNFWSQLFEKWLHYAISNRNTSKKTLEIGAGTLNHLSYESGKKIYDIIEPKKFLFKNSKNKKKINKSFNSISECKNYFYDRIISCAVLEHMTDLPQYLYFSSFKLKKNGYQEHSVPCEGYPAWNISWYLFSGLIFRLKFGYSFKYIMKHEHINKLDEIKNIINFFYSKVEIRYSYPLFTKYSSFFAIIKFSKPKQKNLTKYFKYKNIKNKKKLTT